MQEEDTEAKQNHADGARDHKTRSAVFGVEISQPTNVISVTTIIPSQNLR